MIVSEFASRRNQGSVMCRIRTCEWGLRDDENVTVHNDVDDDGDAQDEHDHDSDLDDVDEVVHHGNNDDSIDYEETDNDENAMLD